MDIIVHGTKGGRKIFTPKRISGLLDVSSDMSKLTAIGQQAYGIRFTTDNTIFSKYKIIRDVRGDKRTGFVGFSLPIPKHKKLSGKDILAVLDKVSNQYCEQYIDNNNLHEVTEDWTFIDQVTGEYKLLDVSAVDEEIMQSGEKDDAFIYFRDDGELQKYFDAPFQEEYAPYRQVLLISSALKGKPENPLYALRHSENDLTGKIDLDNPVYKLREFYGSGKNGVEIKIKNSRGHELKNGDKILRDEELTVVYSKKYHIEKPISGSLSDTPELRKYLIVRENNRIDVVKEIELEPVTKKIIFNVILNKGSVTDAEIKVDARPWQRLSEFTFEGDELGKEHKIVARKGDKLISDVVKITPEFHSANSIDLQLMETRTVETPAIDQENDDAIGQFRNRNTTKYFFLIGGSVFLVIILGIGTFFLFKKDKPSLDKTITIYIEGDSIMLDALKVHQKKWKMQEREYIKKSCCIGFGGVKPDSTSWKSEWNPLNKRIDQAIAKRKLIDAKKFEELRNQVYSDKQLSFKAAIEKIDNSKYKEVSDSLGTVSGLTLSKIAEKINGILNPEESEKKETSQKQEREDEQSIKLAENPNQTKPPEQTATANTSNNSQKPETEEEKEIETPDEEEFENEFWELMYQMAPPSKANFDTWYKKGSKIPYTNKYKQFYNKYLSKSDDFEKLDDFFKKSVIDRKKVKEQLDELKKQIK